MAEDPSWGAVPPYLTALADSAAIPFINASTRGMPDKDGNGKLIVYVLEPFALANSAYTNSSLRVGCGSSGEAVVLRPWFVGTDNLLLRFPPYIAVHEFAHVADLGWPDRPLPGGRWGVEGFATFVSALYTIRNIPEPLTANRTSFRGDVNEYGNSICLFNFSDGGKVSRASQTFRDAPWGNLFSYGPGCNVISYMTQLRQARTGESWRTIVKAWSQAPVTRIEDAATSFVGTPGASESLMGDWILSWFADDQVPGTAPELQQPMWNIPQILGSYGNGVLEPDAHLLVNEPQVAFTLGAPDAVVLKLSGAGSAFLEVLPRSSWPLGGIAILRVR
jgi:hypothetical protein